MAREGGCGRPRRCWRNFLLASSGSVLSPWDCGNTWSLESDTFCWPNNLRVYLDLYCLHRLTIVGAGMNILADETWLQISKGFSVITVWFLSDVRALGAHWACTDNEVGLLLSRLWNEAIHLLHPHSFCPRSYWFGSKMGFYANRLASKFPSIRRVALLW